MDAAWQGTIAQMNTQLPYFIEDTNADEHDACLALLANLPYPEYQVALGVTLMPEWIHCILQTPKYCLVFRFIAGDTPRSSDWDKVAVQARKLAACDAMRHVQIYAVIVALKSQSPSIHGQIQLLPPSRLSDFLQDLDANQTQTDPSLPIDFNSIEPNLAREAQWALRRNDSMQSLWDELLRGYIGTANEYASSLKRTGQALYITQDFHAGELYCRQRGEGAPLLISPRAYNLLVLREENAENDFSCQRRITFLAWGDDLRWLGKWKPAGNEEEREYVINFYKEAMLCSTEGIVIYMPSSAEMLGSYRALLDAGFLPLSS